MKKEDLPQDKSGLEDFTREVYYVKNQNGEYEQALSSGWKIKSDALDGAWEEINRRVEVALEAVRAGKASPILYYMERNLMDLPTLAGYTGFWSFSIKRHLKPKPFKKLSDKKLGIYAKAFRITLDELKNFKGNDDNGI
ncbi:hypothetical protein [Aureispira anguillae]|uniref:Uncharacterized protein n=1 Tax=Aureispira anguillae TaxID=2864201 RepID=A0A915YJA4_9BACT|nr:hypothetical protein [Aureispira anguillae]BDS13981.1 hypothetical protein AsAng_0047440 [Aureispira anguillae]